VCVDELERMLVVLAPGCERLACVPKEPNGRVEQAGVQHLAHSCLEGGIVHAGSIAACGDIAVPAVEVAE
jgi:hypothetical protein